jgi:hypothetical protein
VSRCPCYKLLCFLLLCWTTEFVGGCGEIYQNKWVRIDYFVVNGRENEILVKNRDGAGGIVGFFLESGEIYHFDYYGDMAFRTSDDDPHGIRLTFDFYASGDQGRFDQHIGSYEFYPDLGGNYACVETCFVY